MIKKSWVLTGFVAAALGLSLMGCNKGKANSASTAKGPKADALKIEMYVMSKCPFGVKALDAMLPQVEKMGDNVNLQINYIGNNDGAGKLASMHGDQEVEGDIAQLCVKEVAPQAHTKFIQCVNKTWHDIPTNTDACLKEAGVDAAKFGACKSGEKGKSLLAESFKRSDEAKAQASPTIKINGTDFRGAPRANDYMRAICNGFGDKTKPQACADIPKPAEVKIVAISDKRCKECDTKPIVESLKQVFPALQPTVLDWSDAQAKQIAQEAGIKKLPAILFDETLEADKDGKEQMARWLTPAGSSKYKSLRIPAEFDPTAEICDNKTDDTGDGKVDCDDPTCKESMTCRPEKKKTVDLFVMSQCPYGVMALNAMKDVFDAFGKDLNFDVHFIAQENGGQFSSMHGPGEVDEDIRELCAIKHYSANHKYMDYIWCRNKDIRSTDWQKCTGSNGIATKTIETCATGDEGKKLLAESIKQSEALKVSASPTWLANNRTTFSGISAADIQKNICQYNPDLAGCKKQIAAPAPQQGGAPAAPQGGSCGN